MFSLAPRYREEGYTRKRYATSKCVVPYARFREFRAGTLEIRENASSGTSPVESGNATSLVSGPKTAIS